MVYNYSGKNRLTPGVTIISIDMRRQLRRLTLRKPPPAIADPAQQERRQHARRVTLWILSALTALSLGWFLYRWLVQPDWVALLPPLLIELLFLVETANFLTLAFVWSGLGLRQWQQGRVAPETISATLLYESLSPKAFERYVANLFRQKGYAVTLRGRSGDHGVDLLVRNGAGRRAVVQCKRYQNTVGEETVRELMGTMLHERAAHGFLVTTADISDAARAWAEDKPITLIDGRSLAQIANEMRQRQEQRE